MPRTHRTKIVMREETVTDARWLRQTGRVDQREYSRRRERTVDNDNWTSDVKERELMEPNNASDVLNMPALLDRVDGDLELLSEIVAIFLDDCPQFMSELRAAVEAQDAEALARGAHTLKGMIGNLEAQKAFDAACCLEDMGRQQTLDDAPDALAVLENAIATVTPVLTQLRTGEAPCVS